MSAFLLKYIPDVLAVVFLGFILFGSWSFYFRKPQVVSQTVYATNSTVGATALPSSGESRRFSPFLGVYGGSNNAVGVIVGISF